MNQSTLAPYLKLLALAAVLMGVHYYILSVVMPDAEFLISIWSIYLFNIVAVASILGIVGYYSQKKNPRIFYIFLVYTVVKMLLAIVFLLPLFLNESAHETAEIFNFFGPYFAFLTYEVFALYKFLKNL